MKKLNLGTVALAGSLAMGAVAAPTAAQADVSYNIGVHSKYLLRGIFEENTGTAVQGGVDYSDGGFYLGYWFSNLSYSYEVNADNETNERGFENDIYGGYVFDFGDNMSLDLGLIQYVYVNVDDSDLTELKVNFSFYDGYVQAQRLLNDGWWGNSGDTYYTAGWSFALPSDVGLSLDYGYYTYDKSDSSKLGTATTSSGGFRHLNVTASKPIGKTGAEVYLQYTFAGEDRASVEYEDSMVAGITYGF